MDKPDALENCKIAIIGLGLMGGSFAMAMQNKCKVLVGADPNHSACQYAIDHHIVSEASTHPGDILRHADIIVLAAPVRANIALLDKLPEWVKTPALVIDLSSTKKKIVKKMSTLPENWEAIGGHPMCGKSVAGIENSDPRIFNDATFALTELPSTSKRARDLALQIVHKIGSRPLWIDPAVHDQWTAATSHLPYLIANALASTTPLEASPLVGPGFRSTSRLATSSLEMMLDILNTNQEEVLMALHRFKKQLSILEDALQTLDEASLRSKLLDGSTNQRKLTHPSPTGE